MTYHQVSDKSVEKFKELCEKKGIKYETEAEYREAMHNLVGFVDLLVEMDMAQRALKKRLETEPKGFSVEGKGRNCSLCGSSVYEGDVWYDKWGFKCMKCQRCISLSYKAKLHTQTIRKLIRNGSIKARPIPNGPYMIFRKDNPNLKEILEKERQLQAAKTAQARA